MFPRLRVHSWRWLRAAGATAASLRPYRRLRTALANASLRVRVMAVAALLVTITSVVMGSLGTALLHGYLLGRADQQLRDFAAARRNLAAGAPRLPRARSPGQPSQPFQFLIEVISSGGRIAVTETATSATVIPFQQGTPTTAKKAGQIPADYTEGSGTIVSGTAANKATEAALAAYPGSVVDRVVKLGNGDYEVHYIGVNWPHHVFVNQDFHVIGAG